MKRPAFQFYPADWRKDSALQSCSIAARGLWIECMCIAHECEPYGHLQVNGAPMTAAQIARRVGETDRDTRSLLAELERAGVFSRAPNGAIFSRRMVHDHHIRTVRGQAGTAGWKAKGEKRSGNGQFAQAKVIHSSEENGEESASNFVDKNMADFAQAKKDARADSAQETHEQRAEVAQANDDFCSSKIGDLNMQITASSSSTSVIPPIAPLPGANGDGATRRRKRLPGTPCPQEFEVTPYMHEVAVTVGVPPDSVMAETESFLNHHRARGTLFADWRAAWFNWMRRVEKFARH